MRVCVHVAASISLISSAAGEERAADEALVVVEVSRNSVSLSLSCLLLFASLFLRAKPSSPLLSSFFSLHSSTVMGNSVSHCEPEIVAVRAPPWMTKQLQRWQRRGEGRCSLSSPPTMDDDGKKEEKTLSLGCGCGDSDSARASLLLPRLSSPFSRRHRARHDVLSSNCVVAC